MSRRFSSHIALQGLNREAWRRIRLVAARLGQPHPLCIDGHAYHGRRVRNHRRRKP